MRFILAPLMMLFLQLSAVVSIAASTAPGGTLTCVAKGGHLTTGGVWKDLECSFHAKGRADAKLRGTITKIGKPMSLGRAPRVLIWLVRGPTSAIDGSDLEGAFVRKAGQAGLLVGGKSGTITLVPSSRSAQVSGNPKITIIELHLSALKI